MGGFGCLMLALKHPDLFSAVCSYGAALVSAERIGIGPVKRFASREHFDAYSPSALVEKNAAAIRRDLSIRVVCGDADSLYPTNVEFTKLLDRLKIPYSWVSVPGVGHDTKGLYQRVGLESLKLMEAAFQPTAAPAQPANGAAIRPRIDPAAPRVVYGSTAVAPPPERLTVISGERALPSHSAAAGCRRARATLSGWPATTSTSIPGRMVPS